MIQNTSQSVAFIDTPEALARFVDTLGQPPKLALDTEFARDRTYFPRLCLVQIATTEYIGLIDALAIDDLSQLTKLWANPATTIVLHAAAQDLEVLLHRTGVLPAQLFDTQIAAALAGHDAQTGYATLVKAELGLTLAKSHTRTDWQKRPLAPGALDYAADDVRYLLALYTHLSDAIRATGREQWLVEDCERQNDAERYRPQPDQALRFVRGLDGLNPETVAVAARLAAWRERTAMSSDRPRRWILADKTLVEIAERQPADMAALEAVDSLSKRTRERHAKALIHAIHGHDQPEAIHTPEPAPRLTAAERQRVKKGMRILRQMAETLELPSATLGARADVEALVRGRRDTKLENGWRADVVGRPIAEAIMPPQSN